MKRTVQARKRGDRGKGLIAPPRRFRTQRDPLRLFPPATLAETYALQGYRCTNPLCEFRDLPLQAHHIIAHALGGRSIASNALILCRDCHAAVHRGVIPFETILAWKRHVRDGDAFTPRDADEIVSQVQAVPVTDCGNAHQHLVALNRLLVMINGISSVAARRTAFAQVMLAKAAVLNDTSQDHVGSLDASLLARSWRYRRLLSLGGAAARFADEAGDRAAGLRGRHYRAVGYTTIGNFARSLETLRGASSCCARWSTGSGAAIYHPLSTPGRILQELAITRVRAGGSSATARAEFERGASEGAAGDELGTELRRVKFETAVGRGNAAEHHLDVLWDTLPSSEPDMQLSLYRLRAEILIRAGCIREALHWVQTGLAGAVHARRPRMEFEFRLLDRRCHAPDAAMRSSQS
ncbi:HNH endonuclease signature motif containing protein [Longimicrobium sp.]|uniref:HNH endonuclease signature motif containing protein n=1 Tax=Longimicrobium sp. TaxID=2029185 RepID=UPI002F936221